MDYIQRPSRAVMRLRVDPELLATVRWYFVPFGTPEFRRGHPFGQMIWETNDHTWPGTGLGELKPWNEITFNNSPSGALGFQTCTPLDWFVSGVPSDVIPAGPYPCCTQIYYSAFAAGASPGSLQRFPNWLRGTAAAGAAPGSVLRGPGLLRGTAGAGARPGSVHTAVLPPNPYADVLFWYRPEEITAAAGVQVSKWDAPPASFTGLNLPNASDNSSGNQLPTVATGGGLVFGSTYSSFFHLVFSASLHFIPRQGFVNFTTFVVAQVKPSPSQTAFYLETNDSGIPASDIPQVQPGTQFAKVAGAQLNAAPAASAGAFHIWEVWKDGNAFRISYDGGAPVAGPGGAAFTTDNEIFGARYFGASSTPSTAQLGDVIVREVLGIGHGVNASDEDYWLNYFSGKYGIGLSGAPGHAFQTGAVGGGALALGVQHTNDRQTGQGGAGAAPGSLVKVVAVQIGAAGSGAAPLGEQHTQDRLQGQAGAGAAPGSVQARHYSKSGAAPAGARPGSAQIGVAPALFSIAFNFRATKPFVTDGTNEVAVLGELYPHTYVAADGTSVVAGWSAAVTTRDRASTIDRRLAGLNFVTSNGLNFRVDLPSTGNYGFRFAGGDHSGPGRAQWDFKEGGTAFISVSGTPSTANYVDCSNSIMPEAAWPASGVERTHVFTGLTFTLAGTAANTSNNELNHLKVRKIS